MTYVNHYASPMGSSCWPQTGRQSPACGSWGPNTSPGAWTLPPRSGTCPCSNRPKSGWTPTLPAGSPVPCRPCARRGRPSSGRCGTCCSRSPTAPPPLTGRWPAGLRSAGAGSPPRRWGARWGTTPSPCSSPVTGWWGRGGSLTGYAGGVDKKLALLRLEGADCSRLTPCPRPAPPCKRGKPPAPMGARGFSLSHRTTPSPPVRAKSRCTPARRPRHSSVSSAPEENSSPAHCWAWRSTARSVVMSAIFSWGRPCCRWPKKSPGPRSFRSASAMAKPSLVSRNSFSRLRVSSFWASVMRMQVDLYCPSPYPAPELVELGQAVALGVLDDHDHRVGHVHPLPPPPWWRPGASSPPGRRRPSPPPFPRASSCRGAPPPPPPGKERCTNLAYSVTLVRPLSSPSMRGQMRYPCRPWSRCFFT